MTKGNKHCSGFALNFYTHCVEKSLPAHGQNEGDVGQQLVVLRVNLTTIRIFKIFVKNCVNNICQQQKCQQYQSTTCRSRVNLTAVGICDVRSLHENPEREQTTLKTNLIICLQKSYFLVKIPPLRNHIVLPFPTFSVYLYCWIHL